MEEKKVFRYIKKLIPYVVVLSFLASLLIYVSLRNKRTYTASAVIHYTFESAEKGKTPNNTDLDVNEIKSSNIMSKVIERMGLTGSYSVDKLTSRITITSRPDADKEAQKEAKLKEGEEHVYVPSTYIVAFSASNAEGAGFARQMLDEILDTYFSVFGENYINVDHISNKIEKLYDHDYDYLEMVEYIDQSVEETINALYLRDAAYPYYRSTETGTSFDDLIDAFDFVRTVTLRDLYSQIYRYQITKSRSLLNATITPASTITRSPRQTKKVCLRTSWRSSMLMSEKCGSPATPPSRMSISSMRSIIRTLPTARAMSSQRAIRR